jgi:hypothetical protein
MKAKTNTEANNNQQQTGSGFDRKGCDNQTDGIRIQYVETKCSENTLTQPASTS